MRAVTAILLAFSLVIFAQVAAAQSYEEGEHYRVLEPALPLQDSSKIEVAEYFKYTCGACFRFETITKDWKKQLNSDVSFILVPVADNPVDEIMARAYYTAKAMNALDQMHQPLFDTYHIDRKVLSDVEKVAELFASHGVNKDSTTKTLSSFGVSGLVKQANSRKAGVRLASTPTIVINGKYVVEVKGGANAQENILEITDYIIGQIRAQKM